MKRIPLRKARKAARLTQAQLAAKIGKPQNFISRLESGHAPLPRLDDAAAIAKALGVDQAALSFEAGV